MFVVAYGFSVCSRRHGIGINWPTPGGRRSCFGVGFLFYCGSFAALPWVMTLPWRPGRQELRHCVSLPCSFYCTSIVARRQKTARKNPKCFGVLSLWCFGFLPPSLFGAFALGGSIIWFYCGGNASVRALCLFCCWQKRKAPVRLYRGFPFEG